MGTVENLQFVPLNTVNSLQKNTLYGLDFYEVVMQSLKMYARNRCSIVAMKGKFL